MMLVAIAVTLAIFATTKQGREIAKRLGFRNYVAGAASSEDVAYLLLACEGDPAELKRRIEIERTRYPELTEAEHYRFAIRKIFASRESSPL